jgi:predicted RNase H-like HicB family nuclease
MESTFTAIFEKADDCYIGYVEELPGANSQGRTLEETRENLHEAIELILVSKKICKDLEVPHPGINKAR